MKKSIESILTRAISIILKFLLLTFLAKTLTLSDYGFYQLVAYFIVISISIYGFEFYMHSNREVAKGNNINDIINNHLSFFFTLLPITIILQIVAIYFLIPREILTIQVVLILLFSNFCDYFNQEVYRYLVIFQRIRKANTMLVAKSSFFIFILITYYLFNKKLDLTETLVIMVMSYGFLLSITSLYFFRNIILLKDIKITLLPFAKIKGIFRQLQPFIFMMMFAKGLDFFDKFAIEHYYGAKAVGIYSFLFSIAYLIYVFVVTGFYMIYLPEFIALNEQRNAQLKEKLLKFSLLIIFTSIIMSVGIILLIDVLLHIIGKTDIIQNIKILYILLGAFFFLNISLIPGIVLYIKGKDKSLMYISGVIFTANVLLNLIFLNLYSIEGAAIALLITYVLNFLLVSYKANIEWEKMKKSFL